MDLADLASWSLARGKPDRARRRVDERGTHAVPAVEVAAVPCSSVDTRPPQCFSGVVTRMVDVDYLVVGAGAMGMAFTDALIDHANVRVALVDRRHGVGGHWLEAYPFVRLHQASAFYGVASTLLGGGRLQQNGPEAGLQERATRSEICAYF